MPLESFLEWRLRRWSRHLSDPPIYTACQFGYPRSLSRLSRLLCSVLGSGLGFWEENGSPRLSSRQPTPTLNQDLAGALPAAHWAAAIFFQSPDSYEKLKRVHISAERRLSLRRGLRRRGKTVLGHRARARTALRHPPVGQVDTRRRRDAALRARESLMSRTAAVSPQRALRAGRGCGRSGMASGPGGDRR